jgi:hypothetical protein
VTSCLSKRSASAGGCRRPRHHGDIKIFLPALDNLHNPEPYFEVGQRVVCVDASANQLAPRPSPLVEGKIYVIRAIDLDFSPRSPGWGVHLEGIRMSYPGEDDVEWAFHPSHFRPVTEQPTESTKHIAETETVEAVRLDAVADEA